MVLRRSSSTGIDCDCVRGRNRQQVPVRSAHALGDLDSSFSGDGRRAISFGGTDQARAVLVQPEWENRGRRRRRAAGSFRVVRRRANGTLDTTFGSTGRRTIAFGGENESAFAAALQPDGKIVLAGDSSFRVAVARLNPNGSLDKSFSGDGKRIFGWGALSRATAVLVLGNGKLLLGGSPGPRAGTCKPRA